MSSCRRTAALATAWVAILCSHAALADSRETSQELVLRSIGHISRGETNALLPLFAPGTLQGVSADQFAAVTEALGFTDPVEPRFVSQSSERTPDGILVETIVYHLKGSDTALMAIGQVQVTEQSSMLAGLRFDPAPTDLSDLFPFVLTGISYVHYYVLIALFCVPAIMLYATIRCVRLESGIGLAWIPFILIGVGQANATWLPGPPDEKLFSFLPATITVLGVAIRKLHNFEPWVVSVSVPLGAILYVYWSGRKSRQQTPAPSSSQSA